MRVYFVGGRGVTERDMDRTPVARREHESVDGPRDRDTPAYLWRDYTLRYLRFPVYASETARLAGAGPVVERQVVAYVEDGVDPDRALANLVAHLGRYMYREVP